nr:MAG TPA: ATP synthase B/B' [Caudoviricetes sp.]
MIMAIIFYYLVMLVVLIIFTSLIKRWLRKYIEKRIDEGLILLEKLENINDELDTKIDGVKIKMYDVYLDRCKENLNKKREMDNEVRQLSKEIKEKIRKNKV